MEYAVGVDIGTTAVKTVIIDKSGRIMVKSNQPYDLLLPRPGWAEQDAGALWNAAALSIESALAAFPGDRRGIRSLALSTQRDTLVCMDEDGSPLRNAITWMDSRGAPQCAALERDIGAKRVYEITGVGVSPIWTLAFILWLRENEAKVFSRTACFGLVHDFVLRKLGARGHYLDASNACQTMLYDYKAGVWSEELTRYAGITEARLPRLVEPGEAVGVLSAELAAKWGLREDLALIAGGGDQQCAALGAGAIEPGDVAIGIGTAANILALMGSPASDPLRRVVCHRGALAGRWVMEGAMLASGRLMEWLRDTIFPGCAMAEIDKEIATCSKPGANGLLLLPHFEGAACPHWNSAASGALLGLTLSSSRADMARAVLEAICCEIRKSMELLHALKLPVRRVLVSGGAVKSPLWMQILADTLGTDISVPEETECAGLGAAILAGAGSGLLESAEAGARLVSVAAVYRPDPGTKPLYEALYQKSNRLYEALDGGSLYI